MGARGATKISNGKVGLAIYTILMLESVHNLCDVHDFLIFFFIKCSLKIKEICAEFYLEIKICFLNFAEQLFGRFSGIFFTMYGVVHSTLGTTVPK